VAADQFGLGSWKGSAVNAISDHMQFLGGMTISAIPDMGKLVFTHGLT